MKRDQNQVTPLGFFILTMVLAIGASLDQVMTYPEAINVSAALIATAYVTVGMKR